MATALNAVDLQLYVQLAGHQPCQIATVRVGTRTDLVPSPTDDGEAVALTTLSPTWQGDLGAALIQLGEHLKGEGRPHLHS